MDDLQINALRRTLGQLYIRLGASQVKQAISDFTSTEGTFQQFTDALLKVFNTPISQLDSNYYFTSWDNWQKIIAVINPILQNFPWESDRFDCDKRSMLVIGLVALLFDINTVRPFYCEVHDATTGALKYLHYANIIVDDAGNCYLWDVDYGGLFQKITSSPVIMGINKYIPLGIR